MRAIGIGFLLLAASGASAQPAMSYRAAIAVPLRSPLRLVAATSGPSPDLEIAPLINAGHAAELRYQAEPSGLDRLDPANLRIFGAEIGGDGVDGGGVVSLTWPTEPR